MSVFVSVSELRLLDHNPGTRRGGLRDFVPDAGGQRIISPGRLTVRHLGGDWRTRVRGGANIQHQWDLAKKFNAQLSGFGAGATVAEDLGAMAAIRTAEEAHVFDEAEHRYPGLFKHLNTTAGVEQSDILRCRNDDRAG